MRFILLFLAITFTTGCSLYEFYRQVRPIDHTVPHGDQCLEQPQGDNYRCWDIFVPDDLPDRPVPLVVDLHGFLNRPGNQREFSRFDELAAEQHFIVAWPYGVEWSWNGGGDAWQDELVVDEVPGAGCCGHALNEQIDDVSFIRSMVTRLQEQHSIDDDRVFLSGFSNGCFMAQRLATEASDVFDGVACMAGYAIVDAPASYAPLPVLTLNGTEDPTAPYDEDYWPGAVNNFETWKQRNDCTGEDEEVWRDGEHTMIQARGCADGATVGMVTLVGFEHLIYKDHGGLDVDTTAIAWDFLNQTAGGSL